MKTDHEEPERKVESDKERERGQKQRAPESQTVAEAGQLQGFFFALEILRQSPVYGWSAGDASPQQLGQCSSHEMRRK